MRSAVILFVGIALILMFPAQLSAEDDMKKSLELDDAIKKMSESIISNLDADSKIVILNFDSTSKKMSDYLIDELSGRIVNDNHLVVVDRRNLDLLQNEMEFQLSGEVDDTSAQAIGKKLGAQFIVLGNIEFIGDVYRLVSRTIAVETATLKVYTSDFVKLSVLTAALYGEKYSGSKSSYVAKPYKAESGTKSSIGIRIGGALDLGSWNYAADWTNKLQDSYNRKISSSFYVDVDYMHFVFGGFGLGGSVGYHTAGSYMEYIESGNSIKMTIPVVDMGLLCSYSFLLKKFEFSILGGVNMAVPAGKLKVKNSYSGTFEFKNDKPYYIGFVGGAYLGYRIKAHSSILFDMHYIHDFAPITCENFKFFTRNSLVLSLGYKYRF